MGLLGNLREEVAPFAGVGLLKRGLDRGHPKVAGVAGVMLLLRLNMARAPGGLLKRDCLDFRYLEDGVESERFFDVSV